MNTVVGLLITIGTIAHTLDRSNCGVVRFHANAMTSAGHIWVVDHTASFTLTNLMTYDGVFVGGDAADTNLLVQYVEAGGNVYVFSGGTAANYLWNGFVGHFGLEFAGTTSGGTIYPIVSTHPIFNGVDHLYTSNGTGDGTGIVDWTGQIPGTQWLRAIKALGFSLSGMAWRQ